MPSLGLLQYKPASELRAEEEQAEQARLEEERKRNDAVETSLAGHIRKCWEEAKTAKREVEDRLLDCLRRRKGEYSPEKLAQINEAGGSDIYMMLTATKCRAVGAWVRDVLMAAGARPWGLDPTPVSEIPPQLLAPVFQQFMEQAAAQAQQNGQQLDQSAISQIMESAENHIRHVVQDLAEKAAKRHEELIEDQLAEGGWDAALEAFIDDFATYPAAFIRGHSLRNVPTLAWKEGWEPVRTTEVKPEWYRVSPFDIYPSPDATDIDDGSFIIERTRFTRAHLNQLIGVEPYKEDAIREILREHGQSGLRHWLWTDSERADLEGRNNEMLSNSQTIDALIYCGGAQGTTLLQWGVDPEEIDDPLGEYEIEATLIGRHVIRVKFNRNPLERRPYHKASFQTVPGSFWGQGVPELMADIQDVCNATARALVDNLAMSSGPQVEVYEDRLAPGEDPTDIFPRKVWRTRDSTATGNNPAVRFFQPGSNAAELLAVYEKFEIRADDATNVPRYAYGNERVGGAGQTASGLSMLMESANKGIKDAIRHIDRGVIRRVIEGLWLHNMQYSDDKSIKGDCSVVARGSSAMLIREQTHQMRAQFLQMTANEMDMGIIGTEGRRKLLESVSEKLDLPGVIPSEDKMKENVAQQNKAAQEQQELQKQGVQIELQEKAAKAAKAEAETQETLVDTQRTSELTPLELRKLAIEIMNMQRGMMDGSTGLEVPGQAEAIQRRAAPAQIAQSGAGRQPQPVGAGAGPGPVQTTAGGMQNPA